MTTATDVSHCTSSAPADTAPLRIERIERHDQLRALMAEWNQIAGDIPFRRWEWLEAWWLHYATSDDTLYVLTVRDRQAQLVGLAPWFLQYSAMFGRVIQFLGSGTVCSDYMSLLCADGYDRLVVDVIAQWLMHEGQADWHAIELSGVDSQDPTIRYLADVLTARGNSVSCQPGLNCWRIDLPDSWDSYVSTLSKTRRERVRQLCRRQFATGKAVARTVQHEHELAEAFDRLWDLHQRRRHSLGDAGCFDCPRFTGFLREVAERFLRLGRLRLQVVCLEGRPVAAEFDLSGGDTVYYYQSGIEPQLAEDRPGWLGTIAAVRQAIEQGYRAFDFLRGDEAYKSHWRATARPMIQVRIAPPTIAGQLRNQAWVGKEWGKNWVKRGLKRVGWWE